MNRLAGSLAGSLSGQSAEDAVNQKSKLMMMMTSGISKGVRTNGFATLNPKPQTLNHKNLKP